MTATIQTAVGRFVWHDLNSTDVERAKAFYTELLGWGTEVFKPGEMDYTMISVNGVGHGGLNAVQGGVPSHWLGHVVVEDVDRAVERANGAGGSLVTGPMDIPDVGRIAVLQDPQGATISAFQPSGDDGPLAEGVFVWDELMTTDVESAKRFYAELFGWTTDEMDMGGDTYTLFESEETSVGGVFASPEDVEAPPHWYPYLRTDDVDASTAKAKELGAKVYVEPMEIPGDVGRFSVLGDPTGATFGLHKLTSR